MTTPKAVAGDTQPPTEEKLNAVLGPASPLWSGIVRAVEERIAPLDLQWKPSKSAFGSICLLRHKKRTLLYLTPDIAQVWIAIVLGRRAYESAMTSSIPGTIKKRLSEARPYAEGRGIRFPVQSLSEIPVVTRLVELKTAPRTRT
jgi:hypothetical protein